MPMQPIDFLFAFVALARAMLHQPFGQIALQLDAVGGLDVQRGPHDVPPKVLLGENKDHPSASMARAHLLDAPLGEKFRGGAIDAKMHRRPPPVFSGLLLVFHRTYGRCRFGRY
jgi:hypothetical protein